MLYVEDKTETSSMVSSFTIRTWWFTVDTFERFSRVDKLF